METVGGGEGTKDSGSKIRDVVLQPGMGDSPGKFEETWEHQVDANEDLAASKLDDDVKIRVVWREAPSKLQDDLLVHTPQFVSNFNQLRAIIQSYANATKSWSANDFRSDTKESEPMEVDYIARG